jgi:hypothetical protein
MKHLHFPERSFARLTDAAGDDTVRRWIGTHRVWRKRLDAIAMLEAMRDLLAEDPPPLQPSFRFERALVWEQFVAEEDAPHGAEASVLAELRLDPVAWRAAQRAALGRLRAPQPADPAVMRRQLERFRRERGLWRRTELDAWLAANALDAAGLERLLRLEASLDSAAISRGATLQAAMLDHLRLTGGFAVLLRAVTAKQAVIADGPPPPSEPHREAVLDWYFEQRLGVMRPVSLADFLLEAGWQGEADFLLAIWHDYLCNKQAK